MSNDKLQALDDAKKFAAMFGGWMKTLVSLGEIGSLEQAAAEAQRVLDDIRQAEQRVREAIDHARLDAEAYVAGKMAEVDAAEGQSQAAHAERVRQADQAVIDAQAKGEQIVASAQAKGEQIVADARASIADAEAEIVRLNGVADVTRNDLTNLESIVADRKAALAEVNSKLADVRARAGG